MSKGFKTLKELQRHQFGTLKEFDDKLSIIEQELKEGENNKRTLEIIKEYIHVIKIGNAHYIYLNDEYELITKEEYDLLKEIML